MKYSQAFVHVLSATLRGIVVVHVTFHLVIYDIFHYGTFRILRDCPVVM